MLVTKKTIIRSLKCFSILLVFITTVNCESSKNHKYINVHFIQSGTTFPISMDCNFNGNENEQTGNLFYKKITDKSFIDRFYNEYESLKVSSVNKNHPDNRIMAFVHYNDKKTDTLCFGESYGIMINGIRMNDSEKLLKMLKDKIEYEATNKTTEEILGSSEKE
ncbi:hypothetical protein FJ651_03490 [Paucihalobacter ruber]|uniref:Uncharacterized protein n=1 Tax=Paucihalobacter ruber TaxID=2567861 RepID=A0A506PQK4_9FLAO|nr:hypothetical protein [Paucihalobacter ruber]TPV35994.1 hypothetical protein FJ651_03490 [Paucihalobacter ruber]